MTTQAQSEATQHGTAGTTGPLAGPSAACDEIGVLGRLLTDVVRLADEAMI